MGNANIERDFIDARDLANLCVLLSRNKNYFEIVNCASGIAVTIHEIFYELQKISKMETELVVKERSD